MACLFGFLVPELDHYSYDWTGPAGDRFERLANFRARHLVQVPNINRDGDIGRVAVIEEVLQPDLRRNRGT